MTPEDPSSLYDEYYFMNCCGAPYDRHGEIWQHFERIADRIASDITPRTVLDAGCAKGFLVELLRKRGVEAWGTDISQYAIEAVSPEIRPYCRVASVSEPLDRDYDLIICQEVLEHLSIEEAQETIRNLCTHAQDILFSSSPDDFVEPTHVNVQPPEFWAEQFARYGFFRDMDFDATFVSAWAMRFRKTDGPPWRFVSAYERKLAWLARKDTTQHEALLAKEEHIRQLAEQVEAKNRDIVALNRRIALAEGEQLLSKEQEIWQLTEQARQLAEQVEATGAEIAGLDQRITLAEAIGRASRASKAWKLFRWLWRLGRLLHPVRCVRKDLHPLNALVEGDRPGQWVSLGIDPCFLVVRRFSRGRTQLRLNMSAGGGGKAELRVFYEKGSGKAREAFPLGTVDGYLEVNRVLRLARASCLLWFIPLDRAGRFEIEHFEMSQPSYLRAAAQAIGRRVAKVSRHGSGNRREKS